MRYRLPRWFAAPRALLRGPAPYRRHAALAYWAWFGLDKPNQWAAAEYAWQVGLLALARQWVPARDKHRIYRWAVSAQRGKVYDRVVHAVELRQRGVRLPDVGPVHAKGMRVPSG